MSAQPTGDVCKFGVGCRRIARCDKGKEKPRRSISEIDRCKAAIQMEWRLKSASHHRHIANAAVAIVKGCKLGLSLVEGDGSIALETESVQHDQASVADAVVNKFVDAPIGLVRYPLVDGANSCSIA
jgi:hypothetical protein